MSRDESVRDRVIRETGNDLMHVYNEDGIVNVIFYDGGYGDGEQTEEELSPAAAERLADAVEDESNELAETLRDAATSARLDIYSDYVSKDLIESARDQ